MDNPLYETLDRLALNPAVIDTYKQRMEILQYEAGQRGNHTHDLKALRGQCPLPPSMTTDWIDHREARRTA